MSEENGPRPSLRGRDMDPLSHGLSRLGIAEQARRKGLATHCQANTKRLAFL